MKGNVEVWLSEYDKAPVKTFVPNEFVGRVALEENQKRNAHLRAKGTTNLLLLSRLSY